MSFIQEHPLGGASALGLALLLSLSTASAQDGGLCREEGQLAASDGEVDDFFGNAVAVSGDTSVVGAFLDDDGGSNAGAAYVHARSAGVWMEEAKLVAPDPLAGDGFGMSVGVSGDTAVIGAGGDDDLGSGSGSAYVFERIAGVWMALPKLTASDGATADSFGHAVAISGDTLVVGAPGQDSVAPNAGAVYVFVESGGAWTQQAKLTASDGSFDDDFGVSVALDGDTLVVGASGDEVSGVGFAGSAYVFVRSGVVWTQQDKLTASDPGSGDEFGSAVDVDGNLALVGSFQSDDQGTDSGSGYVFLRSGGSWAEEAKLVPDDSEAFDLVGLSVALNGDLAVLGAPGDDAKGTDAGASHVYEREDDGTWTQVDTLTSSNGDDGDEFGIAVAGSGTTVVVGAFKSENGGAATGSAYAFVCEELPCCDECELLQLLRPLLKLSGLSSTHPCYSAAPAVGNEVCCAAVELYVPLVSGSRGLSSTHPCYAAPPEAPRSRTRARTSPPKRSARPPRR